MNVICFISLLESHSEDLPLFLCQVMVIVETDLVVFTLIEPFKMFKIPRGWRGWCRASSCLAAKCLL